MRKRERSLRPVVHKQAFNSQEGYVSSFVRPDNQISPAALVSASNVNIIGLTLTRTTIGCVLAATQVRLGLAQGIYEKALVLDVSGHQLA